MIDPQTPPSPEPVPSPDATQRLPAGLPQDPRSTVKLEALPSVATDPGLTPRPIPPPVPEDARGSMIRKVLGAFAFLCLPPVMFLCFMPGLQVWVRAQKEVP